MNKYEPDVNDNVAFVLKHDTVNEYMGTVTGKSFNSKLELTIFVQAIYRRDTGQTLPYMKMTKGGTIKVLLEDLQSIGFLEFLDNGFEDKL